ncbi:hypothetical protein V6N13_034045 [Hibiscus sabdariffa]|uniref:Uncharacterized protein n=1 Tax=Hibiscus sabdariffa TaxID=183260 RepID=A0ABR2F8Q4_9ROSI
MHAKVSTTSMQGSHRLGQTPSPAGVDHPCSVNLHRSRLGHARSPPRSRSPRRHLQGSVMLGQTLGQTPSAGTSQIRLEK